MSKKIIVRYSAISGSGGGLGQTESGYSLIADRPPGVAYGSGLGFNGAELLAASLGGCIWNDLHYAAAQEGVEVHIHEVEAHVDLAGEPMRVIRARVVVRLKEADAAHWRIFEVAKSNSVIANSLHAAFPVSINLIT